MEAIVFPLLLPEMSRSLGFVGLSVGLVWEGVSCLLAAAPLHQKTEFQHSQSSSAVSFPYPPSWLV